MVEAGFTPIDLLNVCVEDIIEYLRDRYLLDNFKNYFTSGQKRYYIYSTKYFNQCTKYFTLTDAQLSAILFTMIEERFRFGGEVESQFRHVE